MVGLQQLAAGHRGARRRRDCRDHQDHRFPEVPQHRRRSDEAPDDPGHRRVIGGDHDGNQHLQPPERQCGNREGRQQIGRQHNREKARPNQRQKRDRQPARRKPDGDVRRDLKGEGGGIRGHLQDAVGNTREGNPDRWGRLHTGNLKSAASGFEGGSTRRIRLGEGINRSRLSSSVFFRIGAYSGAGNRCCARPSCKRRVRQRETPSSSRG